MAADKTKLIFNPLTGKFDAVQDVSSLAELSDLADYVPLTQKAAANGVATLNGSGLIPNSQLPALSITDTYVVASQAAMLALSAAETGDVAVRTDLSKTFILKGSDFSVLADWQELLTPTDAVQSVNGQTGIVSLDSDDISEGSSNLYFTDARAKSAAVSDNISDGVLDVAPSQNAVFDALALKQPAGNYITALTGDATASGPGSSTLTLATVATNTGTFGTASTVGSVTVNPKGLVTAAANIPISINQSQVVDLSTDLSNKANITLNNLSTTAINADLLPGTTVTQSLGSGTKSWLNLNVSNIFSGVTKFIDVANQFLTSGATNVLNWNSGGIQLQAGKRLDFVSGNGNDQIRISPPTALVGTPTINSYTLPDSLPASNGLVLSSTTAGVMSWKGSSAARVSRNAAQSVAPNNSSIKILIDTIQSGAGMVSLANNRIIIPEDGTYTIIGSVGINGTNVLAGTSYVAVVLLNGTTTLAAGDYGTQGAGGSFRRQVATSAEQLVAGDFIELFFFGSGNNSVNQLSVDVGRQSTFLSVVKN